MNNYLIPEFLIKSFQILITLMMATFLCGFNPAFAEPFFSVKPGSGIENGTLVFANGKESEKVEDKLNNIIKTLVLKPKLIRLSELEILSIAWRVVPYSKHPPQAFAGFLAFQQKHKNRKTLLYAIAKQKTDNHCKLYCFDGNSGEEQETFTFENSLKEAKLLVEDLYYDNDWHTVLIIAGITEAQGSLQNSTFMNVFDITHSSALTLPTQAKDPNSLIKNSASIFNKTLTLEIQANTLKIFRFAKDWWIGLAGGDKGTGAIHLMSLNHLNLPILLTTGQKAKILNWIVADTEFKGEGDKIYAVDDQGNLWAWGLREQGWAHKPKKLISQKINPLQTTLLAVPCLNTAGVELFYFSKEALNKDRLESVLDLSQQEIKLEGISNHQTLNEASAKNEANTIGNFQTAYSRFGRVVLVPKYLKDLPKVFSRTRQGVELLNCVWEIRAKEDKPGMVVLAPVIQSTLIWDSKLQREVLLMLDSNGKVMILDSNFNNDKLGRMSWRTLN